MVLKNKATGFSLIEVLTAMAVAAIALSLAFDFHRDFSKALHRVWTRYHQGNAEAVWISSVQRSLMEGGGLIEIRPGGLAFANRLGNNLGLEYMRSDSVVIWNGKPLPWKFENFEIRAMGPDCGEEHSREERECQFLLDSLDWNGDQKVDLDELDRNRDGKVSGREIRYVRLVEIRWKATREGPERRLALHPRSRVVL